MVSYSLDVNPIDPNPPSFRQAWALGPDRIYLTLEERESDISVMEVKAR